MTKKDRILSLVPALWAATFDIAMTIVHQPQVYWKGNLTKGNEANPIGALFMENHLAGLFVISALWLVVVAMLGYWLPRRAGKMFLLFCVMVHSVGASTWLLNEYGYWYVIVWVLFNTIMYCLIEDYVNRVKHHHAQPANA